MLVKKLVTIAACVTLALGSTTALQNKLHISVRSLDKSNGCGGGNLVTVGEICGGSTEGVCPPAQPSLEYGSTCTKLSSGEYGCVENTSDSTVEGDDATSEEATARRHHKSATKIDCPGGSPMSVEGATSMYASLPGLESGAFCGTVNGSAGCKKHAAHKRHQKQVAEADESSDDSDSVSDEDYAVAKKIKHLRGHKGQKFLDDLNNWLEGVLDSTGSADPWVDDSSDDLVHKKAADEEYDDEDSSDDSYDDSRRQKKHNQLDDSDDALPRQPTVLCHS